MALLTELFPNRGLPTLEIQKVSIDSRQITEKTLFVALAGAKVDGHQFLEQVANAGAVAAVVQRANPDLSLLQIVVPDPKAILGELCAKVYGTAEKAPVCLAFTGTDGKTTMASLAEHLLTANDLPAGFIGTTGVRFAGHNSGHASFTTPFPPQLHETLRAMADEHIQHVCMEVSSHALVQDRVAGLHFKTACFSHLAVDHLDFHQTVANYALAKATLFANLDPTSSVAILNADDLTSYLYFEKTKAPCIFYSLADTKQGDLAEEALQKTFLGEDWLTWQQKLLAQYPRERRASLRRSDRVQTWRAQEIKPDERGYTFNLHIQKNSEKEEIFPVQLPLYGTYNVANALAALASVKSATNLPLSALGQSLASFPGIVGRMENVGADLTDRWQVLVDFAHTPGAIASLLQELRHHLPQGGKLWTLCNSCGDRDRSKRPLIAQICQTYADEIILTLEEVGGEDPANILAEIEAGFTKASTKTLTANVSNPLAKSYYKIPLRQAAIRFAIQNLNDGDILVLPSLGDEETYALRGQTLVYNDKKYARQIIGERLMLEALVDQSIWTKDDFYRVEKNER